MGLGGVGWGWVRWGGVGWWWGDVGVRNENVPESIQFILQEALPPGGFGSAIGVLLLGSCQLKGSRLRLSGYQRTTQYSGRVGILYYMERRFTSDDTKTVCTGSVDVYAVRG